MQQCTHERDAVHSKSGASVDHSDPGLKGPTLPATASRKLAARENAPQDALPRPEGLLQPKSGQGFGGSAPISAEGAVPSFFISKRAIVTGPANLTPEQELVAGAAASESAYLDTHDHRGRKKGCGAWTVCGEKTAEGKVQFYRVYCKCWDCRFCGPRRALRTKRAIIQHAKAQGLSRLLTLTLDPKKLHGQDSTKYINACFADLRVYLQRKYGKSITYIRVLEYQKNGNAHFHILIDRFIPQAWISQAWQAVGGGSHVHITQIRKMRYVAGYLAKYLTKDMLQSAPQGTRRVTTSRTIKLFEKPPGDTKWKLVRLPIEVLRAAYADVEARFDEGGFLQAFAVGLVVLP